VYGNDYWSEVGIDDFKFLSFLLLQTMATLGLLAIPWLWPGPWNVAGLTGSMLTIAGLTLVFTARVQLGKSFSVTPQARTLVTHGLYSKVRNPIYVFGIVVISGVILILHKPRLWILLAIIIPMQIVRARKEAKVLEAKFGDEYREYQRKTWF
jgi:protein-S-isoprenylcysteine O-methyltransferase Ste14